MKCLSVSESSAHFARAIDQVRDFAPSMAIVFAAPAIMRNPDFVTAIKEKMNGISVIGCSTAGEITNKGASEDTIAFTAIKLEHSSFKMFSIPVGSPPDAVKSGAEIAKYLNDEGLKAVFVLAPGLTVNGSELAKGLGSILPKEVVVTGGLSGDGTDFKETCTLLNGEVFTDRLVALGLYGENIQISSGSSGGWKPFGPARRVTKSEGNILLELDGKPALQLYKEYLGDKADNLPGSGLLYPFAIMNENDRSSTGLIRTILNVDHEKGSLILAGDLPQGSAVCLMHADTDSLADGSTQAAKEACDKQKDKQEDGFAVLISCVGRRLVMGNDVDEEVDAARAIFGRTPLVGFYSYGEISPFAKTGKIELHNQTMTITFVTERRAA